MYRIAVSLFLIQAGFHAFTASMPLALARGGIPDPEIGLIVGLAALVQIPAAFAAGALVDRFGGLRLMVVGGLAYIAACLVLLSPGVEPGGPNLPFAIARLLQGVGIGTALPAGLSVVPRLVPAVRRGVALAVAGASHNLTLVVLPPASLVVLNLAGLDGVAAAVLVLVGLGLAIVLVRPPEPVALVRDSGSASPVGLPELASPVRPSELASLVPRSESASLVPRPDSVAPVRPLDSVARGQHSRSAAQVRGSEPVASLGPSEPAAPVRAAESVAPVRLPESASSGASATLAPARRHLGIAYRSSWTAPLAIVLLFVAHWGVVTAYLPQRAEGAGANIGLFFAADGVSVLLMRVPAGWLSDRFSGLPLVLAGIATTAAGVALLLVPPVTPLLVVAGLATGVGAALIVTPLLLELTRRSRDADRGSAFALFSAGFAAAIALGSIGAAPLVAVAGFEVAIGVAMVGLALAAGVALGDGGLRVARRTGRG